jgi:hypothetical protein
VFQQPNRLCLYKLIDHVAQHSTNRIEPFVGVTYVRQAGLIQKNLLDDENGNCFGELGASFHYAQTKWDYLGRKEEMNNSVVVILLERR